MIVVCGEALIDLVPGPDGSPRPRPGGGPFNAARALARLDVPTAFLGRLSTDAHGHRLTGLLREDGVDLSLASFGPEPTTLAVAEVDRDGRAAYRFLAGGTSAPNLTMAMLPAALGPDVDALHVGTLGLVLEPMASTIVALLERERYRRVVMLDPNIRPALHDRTAGSRERLLTVIAQSTIVKASDADLAWLYPHLDLEAAALTILRSGPGLVVVTLGASGAFAVSDGARVQVPAPKVEIVDTIGAGDVFGAALLAWLHEHEALDLALAFEAGLIRPALDFACQVASLSCARGGDPPRRRDLTTERS